MAPRQPEHPATCASIVRALRLIDRGYLVDHRETDLATLVGLSADALNEQCTAVTGVGVAMLGKAHRLQMAKRLIDSSDLPLSRVADLAGYPSARSVQREIGRLYSRTPTSLRQARRRKNDRGSGEITLTLPVRQPYNQSWVFDFLARRALRGVEEVSPTCYRRLLKRDAQGDHWLSVNWLGDGFSVRVPACAVTRLATTLAGLRRVLDLDADSQSIDRHLARSSMLSRWVEEQPGLRIPGAWDGFEIAVRAILGQQVSVVRATDLANRLIDRYSNDGLFPDAAVLSRVNVAELGMPGRRGQAIGLLAEQVARGEMDLDETADASVLQDSLCRIPGIGPWTASYVCMRVARQADAFPEQDWVVMKVLQNKAPGCRRIAEEWRPWRGYALMYLWYASTQLAATN